MKKQNTKKLEINKETLTDLDLGPVAGGSYVWNTVYYPQKKDPFAGPIVIA